MGRGKLKISCYWQRGLELSFLLVTYDVTRQAKTPSHKRYFQAALTLKGHYHHFHNFTVLFQPHSVEIYIKHRKITFVRFVLILNLSMLEQYSTPVPL